MSFSTREKIFWVLSRRVLTSFLVLFLDCSVVYDTVAKGISLHALALLATCKDRKYDYSRALRRCWIEPVLQTAILTLV